jgi:hypothetical protein
MPQFRVPNKQGVEILGQPVEVEGPYTEDSTAPGAIKPVNIGGFNSSDGQGKSAGAMTPAWWTRAGALVIATYSPQTAGADALTRIGYFPGSKDFPGTNQPAAFANHVYNGATWDRQRGDTSGTYVQGNVASDGVDAGNPLKIGAVYNTNPPSVGAGDRVNLQANTFGTLRTMPGFMSVAILSAQTAAVGTNWTTFTTTACAMLDIANVSGADIEYRRDAAGNAMRIADGGSRLVLGITNADQISFRRVDTSNTQVTVTAEVMA